MGREAFGEFTDQWQRKAQVRRLKGREVQQLPDTEAQAPMREIARLRGRPSTIAATAVFATTAVLTAPAAGNWQPWAQLEHAIGQPITHHGRAESWLIEQASSPLLAVLVWLIAYASWLGAARDITVMARRGLHAWPTRIRLAALSIAGAALTHHLLDQTDGPIHPLLAVGAVIAAWRTLAWATARHAHAVDELNDYVAHGRVARIEADQAAATTPHVDTPTRTAGLHPVAD